MTIDPAASREPVLGSYELIRQCDNCGGASLEPYGAALDSADVVHPLQVRCRSCGLVIASPRLTRAALTNFYDTYHSRWVPDADDPEAEDRRRERAREQLAEIEEFAQRGRLLDVGSGTGAFLAAAAAAGYDVAGVDLSPEGVEYALDVYGIEPVVLGTLEQAAFPAESFDVLRAWHVIEHVSDLDAFVRELHRVLAPGGLLVVGTESYVHPLNTVVRAVRHLTGRVPRTVTSSMHTYVFSPAVLRDCLERRGFRTLRVIAYDERSLGECLRAAGALSVPARAAAQALALTGRALGRITGNGPYTRGYWIKG